MTRLSRYFYVFCASLLFAACNTDNSDLFDSPLMSVEYSNIPVAFATDDSDAQGVFTRGTQTTTETLQSFIVNARYYKYTGGAPVDFYSDQEVTRSSNAWTCSPVKYWPVMGEIDFFAYSPKEIKGTLESQTYNHDQYPDWLLRYKVKNPVITTINELSGATIPQTSFDKAIDAENQQDILLSIAPQQQCAETTISSKVQMSFIHALAGIGFKLDAAYTPPVGATHVILSIAPMCTGGTVAVNRTTSSFEAKWTLDESEATFYQAYELEGSQLKDADQKIFFLPPQTLKNFIVTARFYKKENESYKLLLSRSSNHNTVDLKQGTTQTLNIKN